MNIDGYRVIDLDGFKTCFNIKSIWNNVKIETYSIFLQGLNLNLQNEKDLRKELMRALEYKHSNELNPNIKIDENLNKRLENFCSSEKSYYYSEVFNNILSNIEKDELYNLKLNIVYLILLIYIQGESKVDEEFVYSVISSEKEKYNENDNEKGSGELSQEQLKNFLNDDNWFEIDFKMALQKYELPFFEGYNTNSNLVLKRIVNNSLYETQIKVVDINKKTILTYFLRTGEAINFLCLEGKFVRKFDNISAGMYNFAYINSDGLVKEYKGEIMSSNLISFSYCSETGMLAINQSGKLLSFTEKEIKNYDKKIVDIYLKGNKYIILGEDKKIITNLQRVQKSDNIIDVSFQNSHIVFISEDRKIYDNNFQNDWSNIQDVIFISCDTNDTICIDSFKKLYKNGDLIEIGVDNAKICRNGIIILKNGALFIKKQDINIKSLFNENVGYITEFDVTDYFVIFKNKNGNLYKYNFEKLEEIIDA